VKRIYTGWIVVLVMVIAGFVVAALSPKWQQQNTIRAQLEQAAKEAMKQGPPADPGQGQVTFNLSRAMRFKVPIVAVFTLHQHEHLGGPEQFKRADEEKAEHQALNDLAANYNGTAAIVEVRAESAPASVVRSKVRIFPTVIIYAAGGGEQRRELWRNEGSFTVEQIRRELAALGIRPGSTTKN
jgi:hypothetical protein